MSGAGLPDSEAIHALRTRFLAGLPRRLQALRDAMVSEDPNPIGPLGLIRRLRIVAECFDADYAARQASAIETALEVPGIRADQTLAMVDEWLASEASLAVAPSEPSGGPHLAFVGQDEELADQLTRGLRDLGGTLTFTTALGDALELARQAAVDGFVIQVSRGMADASFRVARSLKRSRPVGFVGDSSSERRERSSVPIREPRQIDLVVTDVTQQRPRPRILVLDDDARAARRTAQLCARGGMEAVEATSRTALEALNRHAPHALVLETTLRDVSGLELCRRVRAQRYGPELPIVFVTADASDATRIDAYDAGGDDVILKPLAEVEFVARLGGRVARASASREAKSFDQVTSAWNQGRARQWLEEVSEAGLVMIRLRGLRTANLTRGLSFGDLALQGMIRTARSETRSTDIIAHWNSDEILVGIGGTEGVDQVAHRLGAKLAGAVTDDFRTAGVKLETGWACTDDGKNVEAWLKSAYDRCTPVPL